MAILDTIQDEFGLGPDTTESSWEDRVGPAAYTPPSGIRITFDFMDISYRQKKKTTVFEFPDADGALVQDHGLGGRRFPMRCFISGPDYDRNAEVFEAALFERGIGVFESPLYGTHDVVVFSEIKRDDRLATEANQAVFEVTFIKTIGIVYPIGQDDPANASLAALDLFGEAGDADFASSIRVASYAEEQNLADTIEGIVDTTAATLKSISKVQQSVSLEFQDSVDTIKATIDALVGEPLRMAAETRRMIQAPAKALASIADRLEAYGSMATAIFTAEDAISEPGGPGNLGPRIDSNVGVGNDSQEPNKFHSRNLAASNYIAGSILSVIYTDTNKGSASSVNDVNAQRSDAARTGVTGGGNTFETAGQALEAAVTLLEQWDAYVNWRDENYKNLAGLNTLTPEEFISAPSNTDQSDSYFRLLNATMVAAGFLVDLSFSLKRERSIVLTSPRSILDLTYELYGGNVDDNLDFFIASNDLTMENLLEIPKGRKIVYYV
jgi:hypothetical protein